MEVLHRYIIKKFCINPNYSTDFNLYNYSYDNFKINLNEFIELQKYIQIVQQTFETNNINNIILKKNDEDTYLQDENTEENVDEGPESIYKDIMCKDHAGEKRIINMVTESTSLLFYELDEK